MEAMACGLPAIGTNAGGVPELLRDGAGLLVSPADEDALAEALARIASDHDLRARLAEQGQKRIEEAFSIAEVAAALNARFRECATSVSAPRDT
jgi:glycosyltransferase involved in cell wall biosynthesis